MANELREVGCTCGRHGFYGAWKYLLLEIQCLLQTRESGQTPPCDFRVPAKLMRTAYSPRVAGLPRPVSSSIPVNEWRRVEYLGPRGGGVVATLHAIDLREQLYVSQRHLAAATSRLVSQLADPELRTCVRTRCMSGNKD
jgi:hypothetical protein